MLCESLQTLDFDCSKLYEFIYIIIFIVTNTCGYKKTFGIICKNQDL